MQFLKTRMAFVVSLFVTSVIILASGCGKQIDIPDVFNEHERLLQVAVTVGTSKFLDAHPAFVEEVYTAAHTARLTFTAEEVIQLRDLEQVIRRLIRWDRFSPDERLLYDLLLTAVREEADRLLAQHEVVPDEARVIVQKVLLWIENTALARCPRNRCSI